jgi:hypothetical protein
MQLPWRRSRIELTDGPEEHSGDISGPSIISYRSPGVKAVFDAVPSDGSCRVIDLGPAISNNVAFLSSFAEAVQIVDLTVGVSVDGGNEFAAVERGLGTLRNLRREGSRSFDVVLTWDLIDYLPEPRARDILEAVGALCRPGALLHTIVHATDTMPEIPNRYRILDDERLACEPVTSDQCSAPKRPPAAIERLLEGFEIEHSFVLRRGVREYVAMRTYEK